MDSEFSTSYDSLWLIACCLKIVECIDAVKDNDLWLMAC